VTDDEPKGGLLDQNGYPITNLPERGWVRRIADWASSRSMWLLWYCTGCGAVELPPCFTSRYDMERYGIGPMATPRQADIFLITGYLSVKTLKRVVRSYEQMNDPKYVFGHGSCTIDGGMYWDSYATVKDVGLYIPVDVYIAGCMPRPEAIFHAFEKLQDMIKKGEAVGWKKYKENYEFYRENQDKVFDRGPNWALEEPVLK
jgi:NADH-quinone oxidoreductase subunit B